MTSYTNHPQFSINAGPGAGHDIAVYTVIEDPLRAAVETGTVYPACLPSRAHKGSRGIVAGM